MSVREDAYRDWKAGMKYKEIAEKYDVSESAIKSWATRYWKAGKVAKDAKKVATKGKKKLQPPSEKLQPKKAGAPLGSHNAVGNSGGAPKGNQNHLIHGAYCKALDDFFTDEEKKLSAGMDMRRASLLYEEIRALTIRERRLLQRIAKYEAVASGLAVHDIVKEGKKTTTTAISTFEHIKVLEAELTKVQRAKSLNIRMLFEFVEEEDSGEGREDALAFLGALNGDPGSWENDK